MKLKRRRRNKLKILSLKQNTPERKRLFELFIKPFMIATGIESITEACELFFHQKDRHIYFAYATETFKMKGIQLYISRNIVDGAGHRTVRKGSALWIRMDETMPDRIDIQFDFRDQEQVFSLTRPQYDVIVKYINII